MWYATTGAVAWQVDRIDIATVRSESAQHVRALVEHNKGVRGPQTFKTTSWRASVTSWQGRGVSWPAGTGMKFWHEMNRVHFSLKPSSLVYWLRSPFGFSS